MITKVNTTGLGEVAYNKYQEQWPELSPWKDLPDNVREIWQAVAEEIIYITLGLKEGMEKCKHCSKSFKTPRLGTKYCSAKCRENFHILRFREMRLASKDSLQ